MFALMFQMIEAHFSADLAPLHVVLYQPSVLTPLVLGGGNRLVMQGER